MNSVFTAWNSSTTPDPGSAPYKFTMIQPRAQHNITQRKTNNHTLFILAWISALVFVLHYCCLMWLKRPVSLIYTAKPLPLEVQIIPVKAPKPNIATPPPPDPATKKIQQKPPQPKPMLKKLPMVQQPTEFAPTPQNIETSPTTETNLNTPAPESNTTTENSKSMLQANFSADYAHNPKPDYPPIAQIRGWEGEVLLRVKVTEQGLSDKVELERSSGYDILDESAIEAVKQWLFTPAKYGAEPIASSVIVPIVFTLRDDNKAS